MEQIIGLKELREHINRYATAVQKGKSFVVVRKSKPLFKVAPVEEEAGQWETVVDFTTVNKNGVSAKKILQTLRALNAKS